MIKIFNVLASILITQFAAYGSDSGVAYLNLTNEGNSEFTVGGVSEFDNRILLVVEADPKMKWLDVWNEVIEKSQGFVIDRLVIIAGTKIGAYQIPKRLPADDYYAAYSTYYREIQRRKSEGEFRVDYDNKKFQFLLIPLDQERAEINSISYETWIENRKTQTADAPDTVQVAVLFPSVQTTADNLVNVLSSLGMLNISTILLKVDEDANVNKP